VTKRESFSVVCDAKLEIIFELCNSRAAIENSRVGANACVLLFKVLMFLRIKIRAIDE
jgi:hypothetical protein